MQLAKLVLAATVLLAAGAPNPWTIPDTMRLAITISPNTLNPILITTAYENDIARIAFDGLVAITQDGTATPDLAIEVPTLKNGGISRDGKTIRYKLRHNVKWHDGVPFTSRDVAFTQAAIMNPRNNLNTRIGYDEVERVETPDAYTVVFHMKHPFAPAVTALMGADANIIPAHLLEKYPDLNHVDFNAAPIGTGPFKFVKWVRGDRIEYVANDDYHLGKPRLRKVIVKIIPTDNTAATQLRSHELDWYTRAQTISFRDLRDVPGLRLLALKQNAYRSLIINTAHPPLDDVRVRRALSAAIDRQRLVDRVAFGTADTACGDLPPLSWAYDPKVKCIPYDPAAAKRALEALGWKAGSDGMLAKDGHPLTLSLTYSSGQAETEAVVIQIQDMLKQAGVNTDVHGYDPAMLFGLASNGGILSNGRFDLNVSSFIGRPDPDDSRQVTCANRPPKGFNFSMYCSPEMEAAQRASLSALDPAKRKIAVSKIQHLLASDVPQIYIWWPRELHIVNSDVKGAEDPPGLASRLPYRWSI